MIGDIEKLFTIFLYKTLRGVSSTFNLDFQVKNELQGFAFFPSMASKL